MVGKKIFMICKVKLSLFTDRSAKAGFCYPKKTKIKTVETNVRKTETGNDLSTFPRHLN